MRTPISSWDIIRPLRRSGIARLAVQVSSVSTEVVPILDTSVTVSCMYNSLLFTERP